MISIITELSSCVKQKRVKEYSNFIVLLEKLNLKTIRILLAEINRFIRNKPIGRNCIRFEML